MVQVSGLGTLTRRASERPESEAEAPAKVFAAPQRLCVRFLPRRQARSSRPGPISVTTALPKIRRKKPADPAEKNRPRTSRRSRQNLDARTTYIIPFTKSISFGYSPSPSAGADEHGDSRR